MIRSAILELEDSLSNGDLGLHQSKRYMLSIQSDLALVASLNQYNVDTCYWLLSSQLCATTWYLFVLLRCVQRPSHPIYS